MAGRAQWNISHHGKERERERKRVRETERMGTGRPGTIFKGIPLPGLRVVSQICNPSY